MKYIDAIEARVKAATPPPWETYPESDSIWASGGVVAEAYANDKPFVVHSRTDIEALLRVVRAAITAAMMPDERKLAEYMPTLRRTLYPLLREVEG